MIVDSSDPLRKSTSLTMQYPTSDTNILRDKGTRWRGRAIEISRVDRDILCYGFLQNLFHCSPNAEDVRNERD